MTTPDRPAIGILGAGRLGIVLAQLIGRAGYPLQVAASGDPARIAARVHAADPNALAGTVAQVAAASDIVILALPLHRHVEIAPELLAGKIVIDAMNYWLGADGLRSDFADLTRGTSERVQEHFPDAHVVKALNHMSHEDLIDEARPAGTPGRAAFGIAGDDPEDVAAVARLIDDIGFEPVAIGPLADGIRLEPDTEPFGLVVDAATLRQMTAEFARTQRGRNVAAARRRAAADADRTAHTQARDRLATLAEQSGASSDGVSFTRDELHD